MGHILLCASGRRSDSQLSPVCSGERCWQALPTQFPRSGCSPTSTISSPQATRTPIRAIHRARDAATAAQPSVAKPAQSESMYIFCGSLRTQTRRFLTPPPKSLAGEWPKLFREKNYEKTMTVGNEVICSVMTPCFCPKGGNFFPRGCSAQCPVDRSWCAQRCCDGAATESLLRRSCADQLRRAHSACRVSTQRAE